MNKKLLIIIIAVVVVAGGVAAYFFLFAPQPEEGAAEKLVYYETGEYLVTNLKDTENVRLIKLQVVLGVTEDTDTAMLDSAIAVIRDRIIHVVRGHVAADFVEPSSLDALSAEICQSINTELGIDTVRRAYYYDFVIQ